MPTLPDLVHKVHVGTTDGTSYVMSDETPDRVGDIVSASGWQLDNFRKNPIALFGHKSDFPVGTWRNMRVEGKALLGELDLAPVGASARIDEIRALVQAGILRAVSVGFRPLDAEPLDPKKPYGGQRYTKQELFETSLVSIPANPNALAVAKSLGISQETRKLVFAEQGKEPDLAVDDLIGEYAMVTSLSTWTPDYARKAKVWLTQLRRDYPFNPLYHKLYKLMEEIETVQTIRLVSAEQGAKGENDKRRERQ